MHSSAEEKETYNTAVAFLRKQEAGQI